MVTWSDADYKLIGEGKEKGVQNAEMEHGRVGNTKAKMVATSRDEIMGAQKWNEFEGMHPINTSLRL
jgi:hypothetical protein